MIRRLRVKLIIVLLIIFALLLVSIFVGMFYSSRLNFERRSTRVFNAQHPPENTFDKSLRMVMPFALVTADSSGNYSVTKNQIHYISDQELMEIAASLQNETEPVGFASAYDLRYLRHTNADGSISYLFSDTFIERDSLKAQILFSVIIGLAALSLLVIVSILLSRWMVKPVERAWEKQRRFVANASHELKTPLTVILSNADMLVDSSAVTDKANQKRLDNIQIESKRMKTLTEALLTLARTDSRPKDTKKETVDFSFLLSGASLMFESTIFDLGRSLVCEIEDHIMVSGDAGKLRQLADILIENAVQYGDAKSPVTVRLFLPNKKETLLSVISEGIPLSVKDCTSIFERFYRMDDSRGQTKGFGLGLSIAQSIVLEHNGRIWAESDGKRRNTFFVKLPVVSAVRPS